MSLLIVTLRQSILEESRPMNESAESPVGTTVEPAVSLIPACLAGDRKARETLARWCLEKVRRTVLLTHGFGPDADDLVQIAIARVFSNLDTYRGDSKFYTWVDRITVNVVRDHLRNRRARRVWEVITDKELERAAPGGEPDSEYEVHQLMERLAGHFAALKIKHRLPIVLSLAHGYTAPEIATMLDIGLETAKKRIQRGRRELIRRLKRDPHCCDILVRLGL